MKDNVNFIFQFSNKKRSTNFFVLYITSGIIFLGGAFYFLATNMNILLIATIVFAIAFFYLFNKIKPSFFELLVTEQQFQVNYYSVSNTIRSYQSIEMPLKELKEYHIDKKFKGLKKDLVITVQSKYGMADYPPVSISILKKNELAQIIHVLNKIIDT